MHFFQLTSNRVVWAINQIELRCQGCLEIQAPLAWIRHESRFYIQRAISWHRTLNNWTQKCHPSIQPARLREGKGWRAKHSFGYRTPLEGLDTECEREGGWARSSKDLGCQATSCEMRNGNYESCQRRLPAYLSFLREDSSLRLKDTAAQRSAAQRVQGAIASRGTVLSGRPTMPHK